VKFLVDAQLPPSLAQWLRVTGADAAHVEQAGLRDAADPEIRDYAATQGYVLVTKDKDFLPSSGSPLSGLQIVWIRTGNISNRLLLDRLAASWQRIVAHLETGVRVVELR
jgi:predicted nuclease of predicted toxin-antitoxin system